MIQVSSDFFLRTSAYSERNDLKIVGTVKVWLDTPFIGIRICFL